MVKKKVSIRCYPIMIFGYEGPGFVIVGKDGYIKWGFKTIGECCALIRWLYSCGNSDLLGDYL